MLSHLNNNGNNHVNPSPRSTASRSSLHSAPSTAGRGTTASGYAGTGGGAGGGAGAGYGQDSYQHSSPTSVMQSSATNASRSQSINKPSPLPSQFNSPPSQPQSQPPRQQRTFVPTDAPLPASLREKAEKRKAYKVPIVSSVLDAVIERFRIQISHLHLHEPNHTGFHVDLGVRLLGTGPISAKIFFPQGVTLLLRLPSHEEFCLAATNATYTSPNTTSDSIGAQPGLGLPASSSAPLSHGSSLSPAAPNGLPSSQSVDSIQSQDQSISGGNTSKFRSKFTTRSSSASSIRAKFGSSSNNTKSLSSSASATDIKSSSRTSYIRNAPAASSKPSGPHNTGELGEGTPYAIKAHLEPVKCSPLPKDTVARIRIEASGPELASITALVNKVVRTHGSVKLVIRAEATVIKAYGLRLQAKSWEKDITFDGLSHLTNILRFDHWYPPPGDPYSFAGSSSPLRPTGSRADDARMRAGNPDRNQQAAASVLQNKAKYPSPHNNLITDLVIIRGSPELGIEFKGTINLPNPGNVTVDLCALEFDLCIQSEHIKDAFPAPSRVGNSPIGVTVENSNIPALIPIGIIQLEPTRLTPGDNMVQGYGRLIIPSPPPGTHPNSNLATILLASKRFLTGLMENRDTHVAIAAPGTTSITPVLDPLRPLIAPSASRRICPFPWLSDALEGIVIDAVVPAMGERVRLLDGAEFRFEVPPGQSIVSGPPVARPVARTSFRHGLGIPIRLFSLKVDCIVDIPVEVLRALGKQKSPQAGGGGGQENGHASSKTQAAGGFESLRIAVVEMEPGSDPIRISGDGESCPQTLPVQLNPDLRTLLKILRAHASLRKVDLGRTLLQVLETFETGIGSVPPEKPSNEPDPWDDLPTLTANILEGLRVRAVIEVDAAFGDYHIPGLFRFQVRDLPIVVSSQTTASLIPHIASPIVMDVMDRMTLHLDNFLVNELSVHGIHAQCDVRLLNFGPMLSEVRFREGLELMLMVDGKWTRCGTVLIADLITVNPYAVKGVQSDVFVVPLAGQAGGEAFAKFVQALVQEQTFSIYLSANQFSVRTGGMNFLTPIHKAIALEGMNGLRGLSVDDIEILGEVPSPADAFRNPDQKDALRIKFKINIPNQSSINLALARITLYMMFEGVCVGDLEVDEIQLKGKHVTHADGLGTIYIGADDQHETRKAVVLEKIGRLFSLLVAGKPLDVEVRGRRSWAYAPGLTKVAAAAAGSAAAANGSPVPGSPATRMVRQSQRIAWLDSAVRTVCLPVSISLPEPLMIVRQIDIGNVTATFRENLPPLLTIEDITAVYELPYSISLQVLGLSLDIELLYRGVVLGTAKTDQSTATDTEQWRLPAVGGRPAGVGGKIKMSLESFVLRPGVDSDALSEAIAIVADEDDATHLQVRGLACVRAQTALGAILAEIQLGEEHTVSIRGLKGLRTQPLQHKKLQIPAANGDYITLLFDLLLHNPSPRVSIHVVDTEISFAAFFKNQYVGRAILRRGLLLSIGDCVAPDTEFHYEPAPEIAKQVSALPSNLMSGRTTELWIQGDQYSTTIPTLLKALQRIRVPFLLQPIINRTLIDSIATRLSVYMLTSQTCQVEFVVNNPMGVVIDVLDLKFRATHRGEAFASCSTSFRLPNPQPGGPTTSLSVPPGKVPGEVGQQTSPPVETQMAKRIDKIVGTLIAEKGLVYLDIELEAQVALRSVDGTSAYPVVISYTQSGLPLKIRGLPGLG
ncbi:unnamed protein product [Tilletia controversa]|nr:unnamed protein product [Tilletia controversa]